MNETSPPVLELEDVGRTYQVSRGLFAGRAPLQALDGVSMRIRAGEVIGLVGESGCGKSTLARILLGLEAPTRGRVRVDGEDIARHDRKYLARRIQPIFQDPYSALNPRKRILDIVTLPLRVHRIGAPAEWERKGLEMLDLVGLPRRVASAYPGMLSGGQRQRVAIARALVIRPEIVVCDEPTSALDVSVQSQILNLLLDLRDEFGLTYLLISHNLAVVEHLADRIVVMYLGRIVEEAPVDRLFAAPRHPYTEALLASVLTADPGLGVPDTHLSAGFPNPIAPPPGCHFHPRCPRRVDRCDTAVPVLRDHGAGRAACHLLDPGPPSAAPAVQEVPS